MRAGIREVRDGFSKFIARVRDGEQIIISDRGRDIAVLRPLQNNDPEAWLKNLIEGGIVDEAERWTPISAQPEELQGDLLSDLVSQERERGW